MKLKKIRMKKSLKKLILGSVLVLFVLFICLTLGETFKYLDKTKIDRVLKSESYSYLPVVAKNYIREVYEKTGEVLLTEVNKKTNVPYLNPLYVSYLGLSDKEKDLTGIVPNPTVVDFSSPKEAVQADSIPSRYDLRNVSSVNYVTPVRNQGRLGLCWTFATSSVTESHLMKKNNTGYSSSSQLISERQIDYATANNGIKDYKSEYVSFIDRELGSGGNFYLSTVAMANGVSLVDYSWKEYRDNDLEKMELHEVLNYDNSLYEVRSTINMPELNFRKLSNSSSDQALKEEYLNLMKKNIMENGAAFVSTYYSSACMHTDSLLNNNVLDVEPNCASSYDGHAMTVIGWDDDVEYSYCADTRLHNADLTGCRNVVTGKGVWLLKNSWGNTDPYPYLTYDSSYSGFHFVTGLLPKQNKNWDSNYVVGSNEVVGDSTNSLKNSNIVGEEKLNAIKFMGFSQNATYSIQILQADGSWSKTHSLYQGLPGLLTVDLATENIKVDKDSKIVISGNGYYFADNITLLTENLSEEVYFDVSKYEGITVSDDSMRIYSVTKNIPSNSTITYRFINSLGVDVSSNVNVTNNIVAENNINTYISGLSTIDSDTYTVKVYNGSSEITSFTFNNLQMSGSGTASDPYVIENSSHLNQIRNDLDAYYVLGNDIDLTNDTREGGKFYNLREGQYSILGGHGWKPIEEFSGHLDGKGYSIIGLYQKTYLEKMIGSTTYIARVIPSNAGLFGSATTSATIKNLTLEDFDITCHGKCGTLVGSVGVTSGDFNAYDMRYENIAVKNSKINAIYDDENIYIGGVFGQVNANASSTITLNNIFADVDITSSLYTQIGGVAHSISSFKSIILNNIQLAGSIKDTSGYDTRSGALIHSVMAFQTNISDVVSTMYDPSIGSDLINTVWIQTYDANNPAEFNLTNVKMIKIPGKNKYYRNDKENLVIENNVNFYDRENAISNLTNMSNYSGWSNLSSNWNTTPIDGIQRIPILKFVDFEYTSINNINISHKLNAKENIYDFVYPNIDSAKRITYKSNNENVVKIDENGNIWPQSSGSTTVHIESFYDGYVKDVPITVSYIPHYVVKFDANGGEGTMADVEVQTGRSYSIKASEFARENYTFNGWNTEPDGTGMSYNDLGSIASLDDKEEITLYAQWLGEEFEVSFDPNGGSVDISSKKYRYGDLFGDLPVPVNNGAGFRGWYFDYGSTIHRIYGDETVDFLHYSGARKVYAKWESDSYTVAFYPNGGKGFTTTMNIKNNKDVALLENTFTHDNAIFKCWNTKPDGSGTPYSDKEAINLSNVENSLLKLYAQWDYGSYTVKFDANGGEGTMSNMKVSYNSTAKLSNNLYTKVGYLFTGWNTKANGSGISYVNQSNIKNIAEVNETITLYAQWSPIEFEVIFNSNGGTGMMNNQKFTYDVEQALSKNIFFKEDMNFGGWNTKADGSGTKYSDKQIVKNLSSSGNVTLYAQWIESIKYDIKEYEVDDDKKQIDKIESGTTVEQFKEKIELGDAYRVEVDFKEIEEKHLLYTGGKTRIYKNDEIVAEYVNVVRGDVNGNAKVDIFDYIRIMKYIMDEIEFDDVLLKAADITLDNNVNIFDYIRIMKRIMEEV